MINISYTRNSNCYVLDVNGHAGYAEHGKDIVCSAVSILVFTLIEMLEKNKADISQLKIDDGDFYIEVNASQSIKIDNIFDTILTGFGLLEKKYSKNISVGCRH